MFLKADAILGGPSIGDRVICNCGLGTIVAKTYGDDFVVELDDKNQGHSGGNFSAHRTGFWFIRGSHYGNPKTQDFSFVVPTTYWTHATTKKS